MWNLCGYVISSTFEHGIYASVASRVVRSVQTGRRGTRISTAARTSEGIAQFFVKEHKRVFCNMSEPLTAGHILSVALCGGISGVPVNRNTGNFLKLVEVTSN